MGCHASSTKHVAPLAIADIAATTQAIADPNTKDDKQDPSVSPVRDILFRRVLLQSLLQLLPVWGLI